MVGILALDEEGDGGRLRCDGGGMAAFLDGFGGSWISSVAGAVTPQMSAASSTDSGSTFCVASAGTGFRAAGRLFDRDRVDQVVVRLRRESPRPGCQ